MCSCGVQGPREKGYGGAFPTRETDRQGEFDPGAVVVTPLRNGMVSGYSSVKDSALMPDSPILVSTFAWSKTPIYIDSLPPDLFANKADKQLYMAAQKIEKANSWRKKRWDWFWPIMILGLPAAAVGTYFLLVFFAGVTGYQVLFLLFGLALLWSLFLSLVFVILQIPTSFESASALRIRRAAKRAPANRAMEYKVRTLLMLSYYYNPGPLKRKAKLLRKQAVTDSDKAWVKKLDNLKKPMQFTVKREDKVLRILLALFVAFILLAIL